MLKAKICIEKVRGVVDSNKHSYKIMFCGDTWYKTAEDFENFNHYTARRMAITLMELYGFNVYQYTDEIRDILLYIMKNLGNMLTDVCNIVNVYIAMSDEKSITLSKIEYLCETKLTK